MKYNLIFGEENKINVWYITYFSLVLQRFYICTNPHTLIMKQYTNILKALSDTTRLKIIWLLNNVDSKICVSEIIDVLDEYQYNVSRHLRLLKKAGLIEEVKEGKWVFYYLKPVKSEFELLIMKVVQSIPPEKMATESLKCKQRLAMREGNKCIIGSNSCKK